ncbi:hypothetical protein GCM10022243_56880 [Saccharothrix violaceirubra]|uniref:ABC-2 type transport system permease protein n=1 Tax=Saccharothrix violaceirubra TaxID=413306 RepID=A0A7W7WW96_9PSEU|nr:DUF6297 family protein [Saccharothrix violaceirubra]MBB4965881.1 hypothetical protein [Saccharothrix violaceirubra]
MTTSAALSRRLRRSRRRDPWRFRLSRAVDRITYTAMFTGIALGAVAELLAFTPAPDTLWNPIAVLVGVLAATAQIGVLLAFGPVVARGAARFWVLSTPVDRRGLLVPRFLAVLAVSATVGTVVFALPFVLMRVSGPWSVAGALGGVVAASVTVIVQPHVSRAPRRVVNGVAVTAWMSILALLLVRPTMSGIGGVTVPLVPVALAAVVSTGVAVWTLGRLNRIALAAGTELASALAVSVTFLDSALFTSLMTSRRTRALGRVRSARLHGRRFAVLLRADCRRVLRLRHVPLVWLGLIPVPYAIGLGYDARTQAVLHLLCAFLAAGQLSGGLRAVCGSGALRRSIGGTDRVIRTAHLVVPTVGTLVWCAATTPALPWTGTAVLSAFGAVLAVYRIATKPPLDYSAPLFDFGGYGAVPLTFILRLARGPALLLVFAYAQILLNW